MAAFEKQDRAARLVEVLQLVGASSGITTRDLAARIGRTTRTALRDLMALQDAGFPIYQDGNRWRVSDEYFMQPVRFAEEEAVALLMSGRLAMKHADRGDPALAMALTKIAKVMPKEARLVAGFVEETANELAGKPSNPSRERVRAQLVRAWLGRRKIRIDYTTVDGRSSRRVVRPYYLEPSSAWGRGTYLIGFDELRKQVRSFKVERITAAELQDVPYYLPPDFNLREYLSDSWEIWSSDAVETISLRFSAVAAPRVVETTWHPSQKVTRERGGRVRLELRVRGWVEIMPWILSWGSDVEVLAPEALRREVAGIAGRLGNLYPEQDR
jgi:predicted DNA-binding transcriptional regulator YafY